MPNAASQFLAELGAEFVHISINVALQSNIY
jgi:hypothetical protein